VTDERIQVGVLVPTGQAQRGAGTDPLARVYLGPNIKFAPFDDPPPGYVLRITPQSIGGVGPWSS
jgi:hypothetical protein